MTWTPGSLRTKPARSLGIQEWAIINPLAPSEGLAGHSSASYPLTHSEQTALTPRRKAKEAISSWRVMPAQTCISHIRPNCWKTLRIAQLQGSQPGGRHPYKATRQTSQWHLTCSTVGALDTDAEGFAFCKGQMACCYGQWLSWGRFLGSCCCCMQKKKKKE